MFRHFQHFQLFLSIIAYDTSPRFFSSSITFVFNLDNNKKKDICVALRELELGDDPVFAAGLDVGPVNLMLKVCRPPPVLW